MPANLLAAIRPDEVKGRIMPANLLAAIRPEE
jgi:hypothetical protein